MVTLSIIGDSLHINVVGMDKFWSLRSTLEIPLAHITSVRATPNAAREWLDGIKLMGSSLPGVITAGTFYQHGAFVFWDVHNPAHAIALALNHEHFKELIVEVEDPAASIAMIERARA